MWSDAQLCTQPCQLREDPALDHCFTVLFKWTLSSLFFFFPQLYFSHFIHLGLLSTISLVSISFPNLILLLHLGLSSLHLHLSLCKKRPGPNNSGCGITWQNSLRLVPPSSFCWWGLLLRMRMDEKADQQNLSK